LNRRLAQIRLASWVGIIGNIVLAVVKVVLGLVANSLAVIGDGLDSISDIVTFLVSLFVTDIMSKAPDKEHAYGHHRAEPLATVIIAFLMFFAGAQLLLAAVPRLFTSGTVPLPSVLAVYATVLSVFGKALLSWFQYRMAKRVSSLLLEANGRNMFNDTLISAGVLAGLGLTFWTGKAVFDAILAILVSLWIIKGALAVFLKTTTELMDGVHDSTVYSQVFAAIDGVEGARNPHRARIRMLGGLFLMEVDIQVDGGLTVKEGHDIARQVEESIKGQIENIYDIVVHIEPLHNEEAEKYGVTPEEMSDFC